MNYRGKDVETNKWVYGDLVHLKESFRYAIITEAEYNYGDLIVSSFEVYPDSVGANTNYYDKNYEMIYEGDILRTPKGFGQVTRIMGCWYVSSLGKLLFSFERSDIEVVGNAFDFKDCEVIK